MRIRGKGVNAQRVVGQHRASKPTYHPTRASIVLSAVTVVGAMPPYTQEMLSITSVPF